MAQQQFHRRLISFDVGIKNMSFIDASWDGPGTQLVLHEWDVLDISKTADGYAINLKDLSSLSEALLFTLRTRFKAGVYTDVVIENQPVLKNPIMKSLQIIVYTFFTTYKVSQVPYLPIHIRFASASTKLKPNPWITKEFLQHFENASECAKLTPYVRRKKMAVEIAQYFLDTRFPNAPGLQNLNDWHTKFTLHKKKDDLADALLMMLSVFSTL
jgi:hypothetical protein